MRSALLLLLASLLPRPGDGRGLCPACALPHTSPKPLPSKSPTMNKEEEALMDNTTNSSRTSNRLAEVNEDIEQAPSKLLIIDVRTSMEDAVLRSPPEVLFKPSAEKPSLLPQPPSHLPSDFLDKPAPTAAPSAKLSTSVHPPISELAPITKAPPSTSPSLKTSSIPEPWRERSGPLPPAPMPSSPAPSPRPRPSATPPQIPLQSSASPAAFFQSSAALPPASKPSPLSPLTTAIPGGGAGGRLASALLRALRQKRRRLLESAVRLLNAQLRRGCLYVRRWAESACGRLRRRKLVLFYRLMREDYGRTLSAWPGLKRKRWMRL